MSGDSWLDAKGGYAKMTPKQRAAVKRMLKRRGSSLLSSSPVRRPDPYPSLSRLDREVRHVRMKFDDYIVR